MQTVVRFTDLMISLEHLLTNPLKYFCFKIYYCSLIKELVLDLITDPLLNKNLKVCTYIILNVTPPLMSQSKVDFGVRWLASIA